MLYILAGILNWILFAFSYYSISYTGWTGERVTSKVSGYNFLRIWGGAGFLGVIILVRVAFGANIPEIPNLKYETLGKFILWGYCGLNALQFVMSTIFAIANSGGPGFGLFLLLLFNAAYFLADFMLLDKLLPSSGNPSVEYKCSKCGKKVSSTTKYCPVCGGEVTSEVKKEFEYVCKKCGKKVNASTKFCPECGGEIEAREKQVVKYVCEKCGKEAKQSQKFCPECGGAIKSVNVTAEQPEAAEAPSVQIETPTEG